MAKPNSNKDNNNRDEKKPDNSRKRVTNLKDCNALSRFKQDPFWYAVDEAAIKNMASLPWNSIYGAKYSESANAKVPGMIVNFYKPTVGSTDTYSAGDYINKAADAFFQYYTQGFSSSVNFQASDLLLAVIAGANALAAMLTGARIYGLLNYFDQDNKYLPKHIVKGLGYDYDDWKQHKADFRSEFNLRVDTFNKTVALPSGFSIADRWQFLNTMIFTDTSSPTYSTLYAWEPEYDLLYDATSSVNGTCLKWQPTHSSELTKVDEFFERIDTLLGALDDDDVRAMFGALRRVYSDAQFKKLTHIDEGYYTPVLLHDIVSMQFHNQCWMTGDIVANTPGGVMVNPGDRMSTPVYQDDYGKIHSSVGVIVFRETAKEPISTYLHTDETVMIDLYDHLVNPANVLDATTTMAVPDIHNMETGLEGTEEFNVFIPLSVRSEVISKCVLVTINTTSGGTQNTFVSKVMGTPSSSNVTLPRNVLKLTNVDSHPLIAINGDQTITGKSDCLAVDTYIGEINRYTTISVRDLMKMHDKTLNKLLSLPVYSKSVTK